MATRLPRFSITIPYDLLADIDQYQMENNLDSRSAAIQELIDCGIDSLIEKGIVTAINKRPIYSDEALRIAKSYDLLSRRDKKIVSSLLDLMLDENSAGVFKVAARAIDGKEAPDDPKVKELPRVDSAD